MIGSPAALPARRRPTRRASALAASLAALGALALGALLHDGSRTELSLPGPARDPAALDQREFEQAVGVRVERVSVTGRGGLIDLRYRVVDEQRALASHTGGTPALVDERTGLTLDDPWMGHVMHPALKLGRTYYVLLLNPGERVRPGTGVTVRIGEADLSHVLVR